MHRYSSNDLQMETKKSIEQKVEDLGVILERFSYTPIESRVFAYLLVANPPYKSFDDIMEFLKASKGSTSNAINRFMHEGTLTYRTFSGDRKRYFMIDIGAWKKNLENIAMTLTAFSEVLEATLEIRDPEEHVEFVTELRNVLDFQIYLSNQIELAIKEWNNR